MGFDELWDGFEKIKDRTDDGINFTQGILKYLQKRLEIEMKYTRSLQALQETFKSELEIGTLQTCWNGLRDETQSLSECRQTFCKELEDMINTIITNIKEDKRNRLMLVEKGNKLVTELARTEEVMKRSRAKYVDARKKQDRSLEAVQKAKASGSSVTKFQKSSEKDEKKADKADREYRQSVNNLKTAQDKFYDADMPALLREFEQHEEKRLQMTRDYFTTLVEKQTPVGPNWVESNERFSTKVKEINIRGDLDLYVEKNRPESQQPPPRAQYVSYDGSLVQDVNGTTVAGGAAGAGLSINMTISAPGSPAGGEPMTPGKDAPKKNKKAKLPSLPGGLKKKKVEVPEKKNGNTTNGGYPTTTPVITTTISSIPSNSGISVSAGLPATTPPADIIAPSASLGAPSHTSSGYDRPAGSIESNPPSAVPHSPGKQLIALYTYDATEENEISFIEGESITLVEKDESGWWRGRNNKGQEGLFPSNFVEVVGEEANTGSVEINKDFKALYNYEAEDETELTIREGEILHVISETDGWYFGTNGQGKEGNFPSNFVELLNV